MNDDEWDLTQLQSISLGWGAFDGDNTTKESNTVRMKSKNEYNIDWSDLPSLSQMKGDGLNFAWTGRVTLESDDSLLYLK